MSSRTSNASDNSLHLDLKQVMASIRNSSVTSLEIRDIRKRNSVLGGSKSRLQQQLRKVKETLLEYDTKLRGQIDPKPASVYASTVFHASTSHPPSESENMSDLATEMSDLCVRLLSTYEGKVIISGRQDHYNDKLVYIRKAPSLVKSLASDHSRIDAEITRGQKAADDLERDLKPQKAAEKAIEKANKKRVRQQAAEESVPKQESPTRERVIQAEVAAAFEAAKDREDHSSIGRLQSYADWLFSVPTSIAIARTAVIELHAEIVKVLSRIERDRKRIIVHLKVLLDASPSEHRLLRERLSFIIGDDVRATDDGDVRATDDVVGYVSADRISMSEYHPFIVRSDSQHRDVVLLGREDIVTNEKGVHDIVSSVASLMLAIPRRPKRSVVDPAFSTVTIIPNPDATTRTPTSLEEVSYINGLSKYKATLLRTLDAASVAAALAEGLPDPHNFLIAEFHYKDLGKMLEACVKGFADAKSPIATATVTHTLYDDGKPWDGGATWEQEITAPIINVFSSQQFREILRLLHEYENEGRNWDEPPPPPSTDVIVHLPKDTKPFKEATTLRIRKADPAILLKQRLDFKGLRVCVLVDSGGGKTTTSSILFAGHFDANCDVERHIYVAGGKEGASGTPFWRPFFGVHPNVTIRDSYDNADLCKWIDGHKGGEWNNVEKIVIFDDVGESLPDKRYSDSDKGGAIGWLNKLGRDSMFTVVYLAQKLEQLQLVKTSATMFMNGFDSVGVNSAKAYKKTGEATVSCNRYPDLFVGIMEGLGNAMPKPFYISFKPDTIWGCVDKSGVKEQLENTIRYFVRPPQSEVVFPPDSSRWYGATGRVLNPVQDLVAKWNNAPKRGRPPKRKVAAFEEAEEAEPEESEPEEESVVDDDDDDDDDSDDDDGRGDDDDDDDDDDGDNDDDRGDDDDDDDGRGDDDDDGRGDDDDDDDGDDAVNMKHLSRRLNALVEGLRPIDMAEEMKKLDLLKSKYPTAVTAPKNQSRVPML